MDSPNFNSPDLIINQEFFNDFENILTCTFCTGFLINPRECTECRILYCTQCLKMDDKKGDNPLCPMKCINGMFINAHKSILQMLDKFVIKCFKCSKNVKYSELINHVNISCEKLKIPCNPGCHDQIERARYLICEYNKTQCKECGKLHLEKI